MINSSDIKAFKKLYTKATEKNLDQFYFKGKPVDVKFAKYAIEYFDSQNNVIELPSDEGVSDAIIEEEINDDDDIHTLFHKISKILS